jgi:hypothetical protein
LVLGARRIPSKTAKNYKVGGIPWDWAQISF